MVVVDGYNTDGFYHLNFGWGGNIPDPITTTWYSLPEYEVSGYHMIREAIVDIETDLSKILETDSNQINLGGCVIGETSPIKSFNLSNRGNSPVNIDYLLSPNNFEISATTQDFADSLFDIHINPLETKRIYVRCNPDSIGTFSGNLIIKYLNINSKYLTIDLKGYGIPHDGTIINNEYISGIFEKSDSPYYICNNLIVDSENKLIIEPGAKLKFLDHHHLNVKYNAQLLAKGTEKDSIIFTAFDRKIGWGGIIFQQSKDDSLIYCVIEYGNADLDYEQGRLELGSSGCGGGIFVNDSEPTFMNCNIRNNFASNRGGGIYVSNYVGSAFPKIPKVINCKINNNKAEHGGGIYCFGRLDILNSLIFDNNSKIGGAIYSEVAKINLINTTISLNSAEFDGGGIYALRNSIIDIKNSILWDNNASEGLSFSLDESVNQICLNYSDIDTTNTKWLFSSNKSIKPIIWDRGNIVGNPLFTDEINDDYTLQIGSPCIDGGDPNDPVGDEPFPHGYRINMGAYGGTNRAQITTGPSLAVTPNPLDLGEIYSGDTKELSLYLKNGGLSIINIVDITSSDTVHFIVSDFSNNITLNSGKIDSIKVIFSPTEGIDTTYHAIISISSNELPIKEIAVKGCALVGTNIVQNNVSGIWASNSSPYNIFCDIAIESGQRLIMNPGVEVRFRGKYSLKVGENAQLLALGSESDSIKFFASDPSLGWYGIDFENSGNDDTLSYCIICNGKADGDYPQQYGGGINCRFSSPIITNSLLQKNTASSGGGLFCYNSSPLIINTSISNNNAIWGGGVGIAGGIPIFKNVQIFDNIASQGGAVYASSSFQMYNTLICDNEANEEAGGIFLRYLSATLINTTICNNRARDYGGGISCGGNTVTNIYNSILWDNFSNKGNSIYISGGYANRPDELHFIYSDIDTTKDNWIFIDGSSQSWNIEFGTGNIFENPIFTDSDNQVYTLQSSSPCIDAGSPDISTLDIPLIDLDGNIRIWDGNNDNISVIDMGAYEFGAPRTYPPKIISLPITITLEDSLYSYVVISEGYPKPDFKLNQFPAGMSINGTTGLITWRPTNDDVGDNKVTVIASNIIGSDSQSFMIFVRNVNDPPIISNFPDSVSFCSDSLCILNLNDYVNDVDNPDSTLHWSITGNDSVIVSLDSILNVVELKAPFNWFGEESLTFIVEDDSMARDSDTLLVKVFLPTSITDGSANLIPSKYFLSQNYPNPFNPVTTINYQIPKAGKVTIQIYNTIGRQVFTLIDKHQPPGYYSLLFNSEDLASGVYFYRIIAGGFSDIKKCIILK